jgi:hypothetical protein
MARSFGDLRARQVETLKPGCFVVETRNAPPQSEFKSDDRFPMTRASIAAVNQKRFQIRRRCVSQICALRSPATYVGFIG